MRLRILVAVTGSLGDLHPMLALAARLESRGAQVTIATSARYRSLWEGAGRRFKEIGSAADFVDEICYGPGMRGDVGIINTTDRLNFDRLEALYLSLLSAAEDADLVIAPVHVVPAHLVAEKHGIPFVACALSPAQVDIPNIRAQEAAYRVASSRWHVALTNFRKSHGLRREVLPLAAILSNASAVLGLFPDFLRSDRLPANLEVVGHPLFMSEIGTSIDEKLERFCDEDTIVFSFGSFVDASHPEHFATESIAACRSLGRKCLYLSRHIRDPGVYESRAVDVMVRSYVPHHLVFSRVGAVVHHGGMGTLVCACRHSRPMLIVPFFLDQPYHARAMHNLAGVPFLRAEEYERVTAAAALSALWRDRQDFIAKLSDLNVEDGANRAAQRVLDVAAVASRMG